MELVNGHELFLALSNSGALSILGVSFKFARACADASEKCFAFAVRQGCRELASEVGRVSERTRFKSTPRSIRARSRALRSIASDVVLDRSSSDEDEVSLARRQSRADFPEVPLQRLDPSEWKPAYGGFFREGNIIVLEARSILYRCAESSYLLGAPPDPSFVKILRWCVESLRLVSGQVLSYRSGEYRQS